MPPVASGRAAVPQFDLVAGKQLSVVTFEVKLGLALDVAAVYTALAHGRPATQSYVAVHTDGLLEDMRIEAAQVRAEPAELNSFVTTQLPDEYASRLPDWFGDRPGSALRPL